MIHKLDTKIDLKQAFTENIKKNSLGSIIEKMQQHKIPGINRSYGAICKNWITNEIFRRIEP